MFTYEYSSSDILMCFSYLKIKAYVNKTSGLVSKVVPVKVHMCIQELNWVYVEPDDSAR